MSRRLPTIRQLAERAGLDNDEALVTLWDVGLDRLEDVDVPLRSSEVKKACKALNVSLDRDRRTLQYWSGAWGLPPEDTRRRLWDEHGINVAPRARVLPKGALRRLLVAAADASATPPAGLVTRVPTRPNLPTFVWRCPGHKREIHMLSIDELLQVHDALCENFAQTLDPIQPPGVRDPNLLASAASRPLTCLGEVRKYASVESAVGALLHSMIHNHPFYNGNKRTALVSMLVLLDRNSILLTCDETALFRFVLRVAQHRVVPREADRLADREALAIAEWICANSRTKDNRERLVKWQQLETNLTRLGCSVGQTLPGNRVKVQRTIERTGRFGRSKKMNLTHTAHRRGKGQEADGKALTALRRDLELDDEHGYDSAYFYLSDKREPDEFISEYRTLLARLAKL